MARVSAAWSAPGAVTRSHPVTWVPLFEQLGALPRADIDAGRIGPRVPSGLTLTQRYGVSRGTAHRAVMILVDAGYARISRGKGTFVIPPGEQLGA